MGTEEEDDYEEYPLVGNFALPEDSIFQYKTLAQFENNASTWTTLNIKKGQTFIDVLKASGVYYIRELSTEGVAIYTIYIDKEAPEITFSIKTSETGAAKDIIDAHAVEISQNKQRLGWRYPLPRFKFREQRLLDTRLHL